LDIAGWNDQTIALVKMQVDNSRKNCGGRVASISVRNFNFDGYFKVPSGQKKCNNCSKSIILSRGCFFGDFEGGPGNGRSAHSLLDLSLVRSQEPIRKFETW